MNIVSALARSLTGEELDIAGEVGDLEDLLAREGWPAQRLSALRAERLAAEQPWPFPQTSGLPDGVGRAQFQALLRQAVDELGLRTVARPSGRTMLTSDERRLLADRPPHW